MPKVSVEQERCINIDCAGGDVGPTVFAGQLALTLARRGQLDLGKWEFNFYPGQFGVTEISGGVEVSRNWDAAAKTIERLVADCAHVCPEHPRRTVELSDG